MKLRNKKTGEVVDVESIGLAEFLDGKFGDQVTVWWKEDGGLDTCRTYKSLAELNEEWEDYEEECKQYWYLEYNAEILSTMDEGSSFDKWMKQIGNYFETEEEAEKAVKKLKAWKRLKDKGFKFRSLRRYLLTDGGVDIRLSKSEYWEDEQVQDDLDLLFGGGDE